MSGKAGVGHTCSRMWVSAPSSPGNDFRERFPGKPGTDQGKTQSLPHPAAEGSSGHPVCTGQAPGRARGPALARWAGLRCLAWSFPDTSISDVNYGFGSVGALSLPPGWADIRSQSEAVFMPWPLPVRGMKGAEKAPVSSFVGVCGGNYP